MKSVAGTIAYYAPEMIKEDNCSNYVDIWALGVTLYNMATFCLPVCAMCGGGKIPWIFGIVEFSSMLN